jgi:hypothetical protein
MMSELIFKFISVILCNSIFNTVMVRISEALIKFDMKNSLGLGNIALDTYYIYRLGKPCQF